MMDTYEWEFPGGSASVTTTTGGTKESPDFCVRPSIRGWPRLPLDQPINTASIFAAEILKLAGRVAELEDESPGTGLPASRLRFILNRLHEIFPDMAAVRVKARPAELAYLDRIAELEEETKDLRFVLRQCFALNPEMGESEAARFHARIELGLAARREASAAADLIPMRGTLPERIKALRKQHSEEIASLEAENRRLKDLGECLRGELTKSFNENLELRAGAPEAMECNYLRTENARLRHALSVATQEGAHLESENDRLEGDLHASKTYAAVMAEEDKKLCLEVDRLRYAEGRLTSLRLEVDKRGERIAQLETVIRGHETNTRLFRARIDALTAEARNLRTDLAAAIKTGEEQALKAHLAETLLKPIQEHHQEGESALDTLVRCLREREETRRAFRARLDDHLDAEAGTAFNEALDARDKARLSRLDALLASDEPPEGMIAAILKGAVRTEGASNVWRWFREQLRGPIDDPVPAAGLEAAPHQTLDANALAAENARLNNLLATEGLYPGMDRALSLAKDWEASRDARFMDRMRATNAHADEILEEHQSSDEEV